MHLFSTDVMRLPALALLSLAAAACTSDRDGVAPSSSGGTEGIVASSAAGVGGGGGSGAGGTSSTGAGDGGGESTASGGGGSPSTVTGSGGDTSGTTTTSTTTTTASSAASSGAGGPCGVDGDCWGDEDAPCNPGCESSEIFFDCEGSGAPPETWVFCGGARNAFRSNIWAHFVDCLRDVPPDDHCDDPEAQLDACVAEASDNACANPDADTLCQNITGLCDFDNEVFPTAQCESELALFSSEGLGTYADCFSNRGDTPCEDIHALCYDTAIGL